MYFPKGIFPRATSQVTISQVVTSQMCNFPSGNFSKVRLGPLRRRWLQRGPRAAVRMGLGAKLNGQNRLGAKRCGQDKLGKLSLGKLHNWEIPTSENTLGKLPLGKNPLGKYLTSKKLFLNLCKQNIGREFHFNFFFQCNFAYFTKIIKSNHLYSDFIQTRILIKTYRNFHLCEI